MTEPMIEPRDVAKRFGKTRALSGVTLYVDAGTVLGLLGPNGAGKTTMIRVLATLLRPDAGQARVAGFDVVTDGQRARSVIGLAGQYAAVDELPTRRENLELAGLWYHLPKREYRRRAQETLERLSLTDAADRQVKTYSGGMRRRLDIGASLIANSPVVFLDEPTTGLDPRTRDDLWRFIAELVLRAIDADAAAVAAGFPTPQITLRTHTGKRLSVTSTGGALADGTTARTIGRADLYQAQRSQAMARGITVLHGKQALACRQGPVAGRVGGHARLPACVDSTVTRSSP